MFKYGSVNPELLGLARERVAAFAKPEGQEKQGMIPGGEEAMGGGMPPGGDPMAAGGMPPGGAPPADPMAGGGGAMPDMNTMIQQQVQAAIQGMGGGAGGPGGNPQGDLKPKIDQNVVMLQVLKILAKIADAMGINIPASDMVVTPEDLQQMAQGGPGYAAMQSDDPAAAGGGAPAGGGGGISPIEPIPAAQGPEKPAHDQGVAADKGILPDFGSMANKATAIAAVLGRRAEAA